MSLRIAVAAFSLCVWSLGCGGETPTKKPEPIDVTVAVTLPKGQPGKDLLLMVLPTSADQLQGGGKTDTEGKVKTKLTPGKYTYSFENPPASVPQKYHSNNAAHTLEVKADTKELAIKLD